MSLLYLIHRPTWDSSALLFSQLCNKGIKDRKPSQVRNTGSTAYKHSAKKHSAEKHTAHKHSAEKHTAKKQLRKISIQQKSIQQIGIQHKSSWVKKSNKTY